MSKIRFRTRTGTLHVENDRCIGEAFLKEERFKKYFIVKQIDKGFVLRVGQKFTVRPDGTLRILE